MSKLSLSSKIFIGLFAGVFTGLFFGEYVAFLQIVGDAFIKLLMMTVLPYIMVSLILAIGGMSFEQAKMIALKGVLLLLLVWAITFVVMFVFRLSFPVGESAAFFSTSLIEAPAPINFLELYIPANPFNALANNIIPAVVLFSIAVGIALISIKDKSPLLKILTVLSDSLIRINNFIVRFTPIGVFAIAASAAGTMTVDEFTKLQVYFISSTLVALILTFWILPGLVSLLTPIKYKDILYFSRDALMTAFTTGNLFIILPMLSERSKEIFSHSNLKHQDSDSYIDIVIPVSFNFPNAGKLLLLNFILFAAWFSGTDFTIGNYFQFLTSGSLTFFGSVDAAIPFLLNLLGIPADLYQLYLASGVYNARFASLLGAMHFFTFTLLATCLLLGLTKFKWKKLIIYSGISLILILVGLAGSVFYYSKVLKQDYKMYNRFIQMEMSNSEVKTTIFADSLPAPILHNSYISRYVEIKKRGYIRVGYYKDSLPHAFFNEAGHLVGIDIELANDLARDLGVDLEFVLLEKSGFAFYLNTGYCDIIMCGRGLSTEHSNKITFSEPYMEETIAFIVEDHRRADFMEFASIQQMENLKIGIPASAHLIKQFEAFLPNAQLIQLNSPREFFRGQYKNMDAMLFTAESGSAWSLVYPKFSVAVPSTRIVRLPLAYPMAQGDFTFHNYVNTWIKLRKGDGTIDNLINHWIKGRGAQSQKPRWSIVRDVLEWVE